VCIGANAPDEHEEDRMYAQMTRVREFDADMRAYIWLHGERDPEYEPPTDEQMRKYERESYEIGEDGL
jgi:hypothetical protein